MARYPTDEALMEAGARVEATYNQETHIVRLIFRELLEAGADGLTYQQLANLDRKSSVPQLRTEVQKLRSVLKGTPVTVSRGNRGRTRKGEEGRIRLEEAIADIDFVSTARRKTPPSEVLVVGVDVPPGDWNRFSAGLRWSSVLTPREFRCGQPVPRLHLRALIGDLYNTPERFRAVVYIGGVSTLRSELEVWCASASPEASILMLDIERSAAERLVDVCAVGTDWEAAGAAIAEAVVQKLFWDSADDPPSPPLNEAPQVFILHNDKPTDAWLTGCRNALVASKKLGSPGWSSEHGELSTIKVLSEMNVRGEFNYAVSLDLKSFVLDDELAGRFLTIHLLKTLKKIGPGTTEYQPFWASRPPRPAPIALITASCQLAQGVLDVLALSGLQCPEVILVGAVNMGYTRYGNFLTQVGADYFELGRAAASRICQSAKDSGPSRILVQPIVNDKRSTDHWQSKTWRQIPATCTIKEADTGKLVGASPLFEVIIRDQEVWTTSKERLLGVTLKSVWDDPFAKQLQGIDELVRKGESLLTVERWTFGGNLGSTRMTVRFPIHSDGKLTHLGSFSFPINVLEFTQKSPMLIDPRYEEDDAGLDPPSKLLNQFYESLPLSLAVYSRLQPTEEGRREVLFLYANPSFGHVMKLPPEFRTGFGSRLLTEYMESEGRKSSGRSGEGSEAVSLLALGRRTVYDSQDYAACGGWENAPGRVVFEADVLNGLYTKCASYCSIGLDKSLYDCMKRVVNSANPDQQGILGTFRLSTSEDHPGRYYVDQQELASPKYKHGWLSQRS